MKTGWMAGAIAILALSRAVDAADPKVPRAAQPAGRYHLLVIKDSEGKDLLVRLDRETGATWVLRHGEYSPSPKGSIHYWQTVPCLRGDTQAKC